jgi:hypothetical protein
MIPVDSIDCEEQQYFAREMVGVKATRSDTHTMYTYTYIYSVYLYLHIKRERESLFDV